MKVFLTFMALFIVNVNMMVFHDDMRIYKELNSEVEGAAESCAHGAAMYFDLEKYAEGFLAYDTEQAAELMSAVKAGCLQKDTGSLIRELHITARFYDEDGICHVIEDGEETQSFEFQFPYFTAEESGDAAKNTGEDTVIDEPSVEVWVTAGINDPFRQPFLKAEAATGYCVYSNSPA